MLDALFTENYWVSRFILQRGIGLIYLLAFVVAINQFRPLVGENGLLPAPRFLQNVPFWKKPSIFQWRYSDNLFAVVAWAGLILSVITTSGISDIGPVWLSMSVWFLLWVLYLSIVNVGQLFYGYGWESLLLEAGFYMIFMGPLHYPVPTLMIFIIRWLVFRLEFGAGLIKMRGDKCWRDLTCMNYHHETQPLPNSLSRYFHWLPESLHKIETFVNHIVQLGAIWLLFLPQPFTTIGAIFILLSQSYLLISGNYAWLNAITLILAFSGISDRYLLEIIPVNPPEINAASVVFQLAVIGITLLVVYMSIQPVKNLLSRRQRMNASFNPYHLVNTYGAFGSVTKKRYEIIIEGTQDEQVNDQTVWKAYEFKGKPGNLSKIPRQIAPYHLRLDWQMWFAAMSSIRRNPWFVRLCVRLLENDQPTLNLLDDHPFEESPPTYIRARLFHYQFTTPAERKETGHWWKREYQQIYLPPRSLQELKSLLI